MLLLDFIRYNQHLKGTKIGCREGDCGACSVLVGELVGEEVVYKSFTSCLTPLGNVKGKHVVTIEGLNMEGLNPIQQAMRDCSATQCGFCTPGFVVSLAGFCLSKHEPTLQNAIKAIDGNICRCTGYKSIERAAAAVVLATTGKNTNDPLTFTVEKKILPDYLAEMKSKLKMLTGKLSRESETEGRKSVFVGGGTDLYVQKHETMVHEDIHFLYDKNLLKGIDVKDGFCFVGGATTVTEVLEAPVFQSHFSGLARHLKLVSSTPIRNMATIAGNFVNASPIGDLTIFFLALNATIVLSNGSEERDLPLRHFYLDYKVLEKRKEEFIRQIYFKLPTSHHLFNFEKVSKRTHLDIASVNTAVFIKVNENTIEEASLSAGGIGPVPMFLVKSSSYLCGRQVCEEMVNEAVALAQGEVAPISDTRGSAGYKRFLLGQLIKAHFITFFPSLDVEKLLSTSFVQI